MKFVFAVLFSVLPTALCVWWAGKLCYDGREGWGWFIFAAMCISVSIKTGRDEAK